MGRASRRHGETHLPAAILLLPSLVNRRPPNNSSMYPSSINRFLCSTGMRCITPLAPSRNETNSSRVNGGASRSGAIFQICADGMRFQAEISRWRRVWDRRTASSPDVYPAIAKRAKKRGADLGQSRLGPYPVSGYFQKCGPAFKWHRLRYDLRRFRPFLASSDTIPLVRNTTVPLSEPNITP